MADRGREAAENHFDRFFEHQNQLVLHGDSCQVADADNIKSLRLDGLGRHRRVRLNPAGPSIRARG